MPYAQVVVGLPLDGPFDYEIPPGMAPAAPGCRALVSFGPKTLTAYIVSVTASPQVGSKKIKPLERLIDSAPLVDSVILKLTRQVSRYYCCSWGIVIESALPVSLRTSRKNVVEPLVDQPAVARGPRHPTITVVHDPGKDLRWELYAQQIRSALAQGRTALFLSPDFESMSHAVLMLEDKVGAKLIVLRRGESSELQVWNTIKSGEARVVVSTRSGVFAPCKDLGVIIIDEEHNDAYKQEQPPHYHCRIVSLMRRHIERCDVVLGSVFPSLDAFRLMRLHNARYVLLKDSRALPEVRMIDMRAEYSRIFRKAGIVTQYLRDRISATLQEKGKVLLFINRLGFSTLAVCKSCGAVMKCSRCSSNLVYHYRRATLSCRHCSFTMSPPKLCPECSTGFIQYKGTGTERIESELYRMFPAVTIELVESGRELSDVRTDADIYVATSLIMKLNNIRFAMTAVLSLDDTLNRVDFRGGEKACALLSGLASLTDKQLFVQTYFPGHRCFDALLKNDPARFYDQELREREQLKLSPFTHHVVLRVRGLKEHRVREVSEDISRRIIEQAKARRLGVELIGVYPASPLKVRSKFNWQVLLNTRLVSPACSLVREILRSTPRSGIIVAVDVDPV